MKDCRWLKPVLVAQIEFLEWTGENHLRHTKFIALRDDKPAREVSRCKRHPNNEQRTSEKDSLGEPCRGWGSGVAALTPARRRRSEHRTAAGPSLRRCRKRSDATAWSVIVPERR